MMGPSIEAFWDELQKIAFQLNKAEQRKQNLQMAAIGTLATPVVSGLARLASHGRIHSPDVSTGRWLAGEATKGLVGGSLVPIAFRKLEAHNRAVAKERRGL